MDSMDDNVSIYKCFVILLIAAFVLKLFGIINISWLAVLVLFWSPFIFVMAITLLLIVFATVAGLINIVRALISLCSGS